jgi:hypothetical protein
MFFGMTCNSSLFFSMGVVVCPHCSRQIHNCFIYRVQGTICGHSWNTSLNKLKIRIKTAIFFRHGTQACLFFIVKLSNSKSGCLFE